MPYKTFTAGEILTASDVMTYLMNQVVVVCTSGTRPSSPTDGRMIYETDTDRLMVHDGSDWRELSMTNAPRAQVSRSTTQSIPDGVQTTMTWQEVDYDNRGMWSAGSPSRLTVPAGMGGIYFCTATLEYAANSSGTRTVALLRNGNVIGRSIQQNTGSGQAARVFYAREVVAAPGDYFEISAYQNSGTSLTISVVQTTPFFQVRRVGP